RRGAAVRAELVAAVVVAGRLDLLEAVRAWRQARELVTPVGVGRGAGNAVASCIEQKDGDSRQRQFAGIEDAVEIEVGVYHAAQRDRLQFAEVVVLAAGAAG